MGNCLSPQNTSWQGVSSQSQMQSKKTTHFHQGLHNSGVMSSNTANSRVAKRPRKKVHKGLIGLPSNFQHTGHIGISEMRSGKVDPERIKNQMAEVAAALSIDILNSESNSTHQRESPNDVNSQVSESLSVSRTPSTQDSKFKIKRKPTLGPGSAHSRDLSTETNDSTTVDPMAEVMAALRMPSDMNFSLKANKPIQAV